MNMEHHALINNTTRVKESNTQLILSTIKKLGTATRNEIARSTGLSLSTCGNILKSLLVSGEIMEGGLQNCSGGRPAKQYIYNKSHRIVAAIIIYPDTDNYIVQYTVTNLCKEVVTRNTFSTNSFSLSTLEALLDKEFKRFHSLTSISIGIPATLLHHLQKAAGIHDTHFLETLCAQKYQIPVKIEKISSIIAMDYYKNNPDLTNATIAAFTISQSAVNAGYVFNGKVYTGDSSEEGQFEMHFLQTHLKKKSGHDTLMTKVMFAIASSLATFHPDVILLSKSETSAISLQEIKDRCMQTFPNEPRPKFILEENPLKVCASGALDTAISNLQPNLTLVSR